MYFFFVTSLTTTRDRRDPRGLETGDGGWREPERIENNKPSVLNAKTEFGFKKGRRLEREGAAHPNFALYIFFVCGGGPGGGRLKNNDGIMCGIQFVTVLKNENLVNNQPWAESPPIPYRRIRNSIISLFLSLSPCQEIVDLFYQFIVSRVNVI